MVNLGFFRLLWENPQYLLNLSKQELWDKHISETSRFIGKEVCIVLDNIYSEGMGASSYELKEGGKSVLITKNPLPKIDSTWWFPSQQTPEESWMFLLSADTDTRLQVANKLKLKFPSGMIPLDAMAKEMWWLPEQSVSTIAQQDSTMSIQKIIDNVVAKNYVTLIGRIAED